MRILNLSLLIIALVGAFFAAGKIREAEDLRFEKAGLVATVGDLRVKDPRDTCLINVVDDKTFFHWRVHIPKDGKMGHRVLTQSSLGRGGITTFAEAKFCDYLCSFRFSPGKTQMYVRSHSGSGLYNLETKGGSEFLEKHWNELDFRYVQDKASRVIGADELVCLLEIEVPDRLMDEYRKACPNSFNLTNTVARIHIGGPAAMAKPLPNEHGFGK